MEFNPNCMAMAIGSLPHVDVNKALDVVLRSLLEAPIWPQLPKRSFNESMMVQYTEGMPCVNIDSEKKKVYFDTSRDDFFDLLSHRFGLALEEKAEEFAISREFAHGFYALLERIKADFPSSIKILKGHVTGPISFGLSLHDENGKSVLYNDDLKDAVVKMLAMKAKWQVNEFKKLNSDVTPLIFFDEPSLTQIGTPFVSLGREDAIEILNTCLDAVDGISGIHVCGNTDWSLVTSTNTDVINFDAYAYPESLPLYPAEIRGFLERGGMIAWGVVPSTVEIADEDSESIFKKFEYAVELLCKTGIDKEFVLRRSFITPSCGTGSLTEELAEMVFRINSEVSGLARKKYF